VKVAIWTENSLDGAAAACVLKQLFKEADISGAYHYEFPGILKGWLTEHFGKYDKVFILNLSIPDELLCLIDNKKTVIINNRSFPKEKTQYAKVVVEDSTSCTSLILSKFTDTITLTPQQSKLYDLVDDYASSTFNDSDSLKLNAVYCSYNNPKVNNFIDRFERGYDEFSVLEKNAIKLYFKKYKESITSSDFYMGLIKDYRVVSCFSEHAIDEVLRYSLKKFTADIAIVVNPTARLVFFAKNKDTCTLKVDKLAIKLCEGAGHESFATGKLTESFLAFTKSLTQCIID
jgi:oligoribonuclease NrnB/cAMP/cGMP phosphodiesterase (DHH superfamily)